jgi:hypothetical protein
MQLDDGAPVAFEPAVLTGVVARRCEATAHRRSHSSPARCVANDCVGCADPRRPRVVVRRVMRGFRGRPCALGADVVGQRRSVSFVGRSGTRESILCRDRLNADGATRDRVAVRSVARSVPQSIDGAVAVGAARDRCRSVLRRIGPRRSRIGAEVGAPRAQRWKCDQCWNPRKEQCRNQSMILCGRLAISMCAVGWRCRYPSLVRAVRRAV